MQIHNVLYRGWTMVMLVTLLLPTASRPGTATLTGAFVWAEVGAGSASGGGISDNGCCSYHPSVAVAPDGRPYVAWHDYSGGDEEIYVRRWNGSSWEEVGSGSASGGGISDNDGWSYDPSVAVAPDGRPYVAWYDDSGGDPEIYVRRWNGSSWEEVGSGSASGGGISDNSGNSSRASVAVAGDGTPYVAWYDDSSGDEEIYVRRWVYRELGYLPLVLKDFCDPYDPNENRGTAWGPLASGQIIRAQICPWDSRDVYYFHASGPVQVTIDLTNMPGHVDFDLYLWDQTGFDPVARSEKPAGQDERIVYTLPGYGFYYVEVYPYSGTGSYTLQGSGWE